MIKKPSLYDYKEYKNQNTVLYFSELLLNAHLGYFSQQLRQSTVSKS